MAKRVVTWLVWLLCGVVLVASSIRAAQFLRQNAGASPLYLGGETLFYVLPVVLAVLGALILTYRPGHAVGWLMLAPPVSVSIPLPAVAIMTTPPATATFGLYVALWFEEWNWMLLIFPLLLLPLLYPTGRPPSPRWGWVLVLAGAMILFLLFWVTFKPEFVAPRDAWSLPNPIALPWVREEMFPYSLWAFALFVLIALSVASPFVRYRTAGYVERQQIKWLLYACSLFGLIFGPSLFISQIETNQHPLFNLFFALAVFAIPAAIAIGILRYRALDIDVVIRRTIQYGIVTLLLGLVYIGSVILLQLLLLRTTGQTSQAVIVLSTLAIAALFNPLRLRVQRWMDRRFYRARYDAEQIIAAFAQVARDEPGLGILGRELLAVVRDTLHPTMLSLWLAPPTRRPGHPHKHPNSPP
jgi:hypothetical protein